MSKVSYFGRDGRPCQKVEWDRLREDDSYRIVRQYDNGSVRVVLEWFGVVSDAHNLFPDCYKLFMLHVNNYNDRNEPIRDPVEGGRTFANEAAAVEAYENFLVRWTNSFIDGDGEFMDMDNDLKPPPPPDPDEPTSDVATIKGIPDDGVGAW